MFFFSSSQIRRWGNVEWAHDYDMYELRARTAAGALFVHLSSESSTVKRKLLRDWKGLGTPTENVPYHIQRPHFLFVLFGSDSCSISDLLYSHLTPVKHAGSPFCSVYMKQLPSVTPFTEFPVGFKSPVTFWTATHCLKRVVKVSVVSLMVEW